MNQKTKYNWNFADWSQQDIEIARKFNCSRERVRQVRANSAIGNGQKADNHRRRTIPTAKIKLANVETSDKTLLELSKIAGCNVRSVGGILQEMSKSYKRRPRGGQIYDWSKFPVKWVHLTDKEIAAFVGANYPAVVAQWRARHGYKRGCSCATLPTECICP